MHRTIAILFLLITLAGCTTPGATPAMQMPGTPPAERDYSATLTGDNGIFRMTYTSALDPIAINELHDWTLHVETTNGTPVDNAVISVTGGMPEHNHGMPTQPSVTQILGGGDYRIEGMQFQMNGWWTVTFVVEAAGQQDSVTFNLQLK